MSTPTSNNIYAIIHHKIRLLDRFAMENPIYVSANNDQNYTNVIHHCKTSLFDSFVMENSNCASVNPDLKQYTCGNQSQNTYVLPFGDGKSDLCRCQP